MQCSYCSHKNLGGASVCNNCGVILREIKRAKPAPRERADIAGAAKSFFGAPKALKNLSSAQTRLKDGLEAVETRCKEELEKSPNSGTSRLNLGLIHLLRDEIEAAVQAFQLAKALGIKGPAFYNNAGVALGRRGNLNQAIDTFEHAISCYSSEIPHPYENLAHAVLNRMDGLDTATAEKAEQAIRKAIEVGGEASRHYNRLGQIHCRYRQFDQAEEDFTKARSLAAGSPTDEADVLNNLGILFAMKGDIAASGQFFADAIKLNAGHGRACTNQALLLVQQQMNDLAVERLIRAARIDPKSAVVRNNAGYALSRACAFNEGIREFKEASLLEPHLFEPVYNQGKTYADEGLYDIAERYLSRAVQTTTQSWHAMTVLGVIRIAQKQLPQARQAFERARENNPTDALALGNLGICAGMMQDYVFAETCLKQALELSENDPHLHVNLGWLHLIQGHVSMAIGELTVALSLNDKQPKAHNNCGLCHIENSNYPQAIKHFRRALSQNPDLGQINYQLGCAHLLNRDVEDAIKDWELSTKAEPQFPDGFANLGVAYYKKKTYDKALAAFRRVLALRTTRMEDWSNAGLTYGKQGMELKALSKKPGDTKHKESMERHRLAVEMFDAALAIHPTNPQLHSNRGLACFFANMPEQAMYEWSMVTKLDPSYAKRRGKALQSEFDDSAIDFIPVNTSERAMSHTPRTPGYLSRYAYGYDTNQWVLMIEDPELAELAELSKEVRNLERIANAL